MSRSTSTFLTICYLPVGCKYYYFGTQRKASFTISYGTSPQSTALSELEGSGCRWWYSWLSNQSYSYCYFCVRNISRE
ncbi:hypothetical protein GGTG_00586 [Gaeumannomyces tritici R3-111a-1]|uniref:Uncharacterized protein n=1 Tax=Gaeumannomyces tritici (strain R3-111a-1) TaxID=644352 RepID=J3NH48_GAET3|nr:hypothetical protein GGTG_00586 [Gaeumannomyces tritici R3-111a-1]EJT80591.1 hypothetical protein GGTG_00586 [Gaeumannomyces tritici R3-111a-1]